MVGVRAAGSRCVCWGMAHTAMALALPAFFFVAVGAGSNCSAALRVRFAPTTSSGTAAASTSESSSSSSEPSLGLIATRAAVSAAAAAGAAAAGAAATGVATTGAGAARSARAVGKQTAEPASSSPRFGVVSQSGPSEASGFTTITRSSIRRSYFLGGSAFRNSCAASNCASMRAEAFSACRLSWRASALTFSAIPLRALFTSVSMRLASGARMYVMMAAGL